MFLKTIAHCWASSKLEEEKAQTQSLIRELDRAKNAANERIQAKRSDYSSKIKTHQEKRNKELQTHIDFMNEQLKTTADYVHGLNDFQSLMFTCVDSWMQVDLCQQEINIVYQKLSATFSTINLIDAYISELKMLSQHQERYMWRKFTTTRELTVLDGFIEKIQDQINRTSKTNHDEFKNELRRIQSHQNSLKKEINELHAERIVLLKRKSALNEQYKVNKNTLSDKYESCLWHWMHISKKFEAYYAHKLSGNQYADDWLRNLKEGGTLPEIIKVIGEATITIKDAKDKFFSIKRDYDFYKHRVQEAHDTKEYSDTFANDKEQRKNLKSKLDDAFQTRKALIDAQSVLYTRRNELRGYIDRIKPLHPDTAIDALCEMFSADDDFNALLVFGINTSRQKREYWEKNQKRVENATAN